MGMRSPERFKSRHSFKKNLAQNGQSWHFWKDEDTEFFSRRLKEVDIMRRLDRRKCRTGDLFKAVADKLTDAGFVRMAEPARQRF